MLSPYFLKNLRISAKVREGGRDYALAEIQHQIPNRTVCKGILSASLAEEIHIVFLPSSD